MLILIFRARFYRNKTTFLDKINNNLIFSSQNAVVRMENKVVGKLDQNGFV
jgi:hypothetical protein